MTNDSRDSRLEAFLRQASAIIAAEKGLSNSAKAKLEDLAGRLHLPDELFEIGLQQLQDSNAPIGELTAYERGFLKFLLKEFKRMPGGTVLSISMEEKAIAHAKNKFEIPSHRAEQLIEYQTRESGFGRLSRADAREFGRQSILESIGEKTQLNEEVEERVYRLGRRWGYTQEEVNVLVDEKLRENYQLAKAERRRPIILSLALLICVSMVGAGAWWLYQNREQIFALNELTQPDPAPAEIETPVEAEVEPKSKSKIESLFPAYADSFRSGTIEQRQQAIEAMIVQTLEAPQNENEQANVLREWYLAEPNPIVADRLVQVIDRSLSEQPVSNRNQRLAMPYRAAEFSVGICIMEATTAIESQRIEAIESIVRNRTSVSFADVKNALAKMEATIAVRQWSNLIQNSYSQPGRSSILIEPLADLTKTKLNQNQYQDFVSRSVRAVLMNDKSQWRNVKQAIKDSIASSDQIQQIEWIEIWLDEFDGSFGFRDYTSELLTRSRGIESELTMLETESFLKTQRLNWRNRLLQPAIVRHQKINESISKLQPMFQAAQQQDADPDLIFLAVQLANICLESNSILQSGNAGNPSAWSEIDSQFSKLDQRLRDFMFLNDNVSSDPKVSSAGFDTTNLERTLDAFSDRTQRNGSKRLAAIERLPKLTDRFESIPTPMANELAVYLTSPIEADEWLQVQRVVSDLVNWPRVLLAISDQLPESTASIDQTVMLSNLLTGEVWQGEKSSNWRVDLSEKIFGLAHEVLQLEELTDPSASDSDWLRLEKFLESAYYRRAILLGADETQTNRSAVRMAEVCFKATVSNESVASRAVEMIKAETANEIEQVVLLNRMLSDMRSSSANPNVSVGMQLLQVELQILKRWQDEFNHHFAEMIDAS
jgi:hypothetical protein